MAFHDLRYGRICKAPCHDTDCLYLEKEKARLDNQSVVAYNYYKNLIEKRRHSTWPTKHAKEMAKLAYDALADKKAQDIKIINIEGVRVIAELFLSLLPEPTTIRYRRWLTA